MNQTTIMSTIPNVHGLGSELNQLGKNTGPQLKNRTFIQTAPSPREQLRIWQRPQSKRRALGRLLTWSYL